MYSDNKYVYKVEVNEYSDAMYRHNKYVYKVEVNEYSVYIIIIRKKIKLFLWGNDPQYKLKTGHNPDKYINSFNTEPMFSHQNVNVVCLSVL